MQLSKKLTVLTIAIALVGASCSPTTTTTIANPFPRGPVKITIWRPFDERTGFRDVANQYHNDHPNVTFDYQTINPATYEADVINALATGKGPDIISIPNDSVFKFHDKLVAMPNGFFGAGDNITSLTALYAPAVTTDTVITNKIFGIPLYTDTLSLIWNTAMFNTVFNQLINQNIKFNQTLLTRAPADWNEVVETSKLLTKRNGDTITQAGIALGTTNNIPNASDILAAMILQRGTGIVSSDNTQATFHLADPSNPKSFPTTDIFNYLRSFSDPKSANYSWNESQPNALDAFIQGNVGMILDYKDVGSIIHQRNPQLAVDAAPLPQVPNAATIVDYAHYNVEAVTNNSQFPQVAWDFLKSESNSSSFTLATGRPSALRELPATTTVTERRSRNDSFALQIATAQSWFKGNDPKAADTVLTDAFNRFIHGNAGAQASINQAAADLTNLLRSP